MFIHTDYDNTYSGYDSDYSNYSNYSTNSSCTTYSSRSSNSSNFTITSDPSNYYKKDNLKQNYQKFLRRLQQTQKTQTLTNYTSISLRKKQTQNYLEIHRHKMNYIRDNEEENNSNIDIIDNSDGYDSGFNKDTPFINYLITKRISFCELGASSHIAAFVPSLYTQRNCLIRGWKGKDHYG